MSETSKTRVLPVFLFCLLVLCFAANNVYAKSSDSVEEINREDLKTLLSVLDGLEFGSKAYLDYSAGEKGGENGKESSYNEFAITRGYFTVEKTFRPWLHSRMTYDVHRVEQEGEDEHYVARLKYFYAELQPDDLGFLTDMHAEIGQGHMPWLDFEEHINPYRSQGKMAIERAGVFNSADLGVSVRGSFGGSLENPVEKTGSDHFTGKYGGWHVGVYNGPGYHESEENNNKVLEGRLSLRPLPEIVPGLKFSYFGLRGEGNKKYNGQYPDYEVDLGMISFQHPMLTLTSQYYQTEGEKDGKWTAGNWNNNEFTHSGEALDTEGYSFFGDVTLPVMEQRLSLFGRYDYFDIDEEDKIAEDTAYDMYIGGLSYQLYKDNMLLLAYEKTDYEQDAAGKGNTPKANAHYGDDQKVQAVWRLKF